MKIFVVADAETVLAFALAGLQGQAVESATEVPAILAGITRGQAGLILITEVLAEHNREAIEQVLLDPAGPLIVEIPGRGGPLPKKVRTTERLVALLRR
jgi:vacuolar-type H+-ATPase subunit F/Vma7